MRVVGWFLAATAIVATVVCDFDARSSAADEASATRSGKGLLALYDFASAKGPVIKDRSGVGEPINLRIADPKAVRRSAGALQVTGETVIRSEQPAERIIKAIRRSGEITIEAWVQPAKTNQKGPARIVTLSGNTSVRNVTLGQEGETFDVRLRTTKTSTNGLPSVSSPKKSLKTKLTHIVYTRDRSGRARMYLNGKQRADKKVDGSTSNWDGKFHLGLANEMDRGRVWLGTYHLIAIYGRALTPPEVQRHFKAGPQGATPSEQIETAGVAADEASAARSGKGLLALYDFASASGAVIEDRSGAGTPINLRIADMKAVRRSAGALEVTGETVIRSEQPAKRIVEAVRRSGELTIEAWIKPAKTDQKGPARIVTLSRNSGERNFTLGQEGDLFDVRLRTTKTTTNGIPSLSTKKKSLRTKLTHVVYARDRSGRTRMYVDGRAQANKRVEGSTSNWSGDYHLGLANEMDKGRMWLGTYQLVAIYGRAISPGDVQRHFKAGPQGVTGSEQLAAATFSPAEQHFADHIAPLFANHCLECHDTAAKEGGLDLSRKGAAFAGGEGGKVLVAGSLAKSRLWEAVAADEMPQDKPPLSTEEKEQLRKWIEDGAVWPVEVIDPTLYAHSGKSAQNYLRRLTVSEYIETVRAAVGVDIAKEAREILPPDLRADGFSNTAYNLGVDLKHVEAYARLAEIIVSRMDVEKFAARFSKSRKLSTDDTMRQFVAGMGKWLLRGPLDEREEISFSGIPTTVASAGGDFDEATGYLIQAMLQSPRFLYRVENQVGDGTAWPVGEYELASRLSYILWGGPPDQQLMQAADNGELYDPAKVEAQVGRMLADSRAAAHSKQFVSQWLNLDGLSNLAPNGDRFPNWNSQLGADMRDETLAFFEEVVWKQNRPLADLLNAQVTFVTPRLAKHYGLTPNKDGELRYDLASIPGRGGLLTQGSVLTVGGDDASMVTRGLFVLHDLLRGTVKDPPPGVDTKVVPSRPGLTQRTIAEGRLANSSCGGCHARFEPLSFGLERFDGLGTYRETDEYGNTLREDGEILFPGTGKPVPFKTSAQLMDLLAGNERVQESITWKLTQFALGRPLTAADAPIVASIHKSAQQQGGTYASLMTALVMSDLVQTTRTEAMP